MKKHIITLVVVLVAGVCVAGKINLKNDPALKAKDAIAKDADASVKWSAIKTDTEQAKTFLDGCTNSVWSGNAAQKAYMLNMEKAIANTIQALNKTVRKLKESEEAKKKAQQQ